MVVHPCSHGVSRVPRYSGYPLTCSSFRLRGSHPLWPAFPCRSSNHHMLNAGPYPGKLGLPVWPPPRSLATTCGISVDVFSSPYLDVSVQAVPSVRLWIHRTVTEYCSAGLPHSVICGSRLMCSSPQLIAACHDLRRLLMPRHPPCALFSLTYSGSRFENYADSTSGFEIIDVTLFLRFSLCCLACFLIISIVQFSRCSFRHIRPEFNAYR